MSSSEIIEDVRTLLVTEEDAEEFKRLDQYLTSKQEDLSRNFIKSLFENGQITAEKKLKLNKMPSPGTEITIQVPPPPPMNAEPEDIPLPILFEDEELVIVNKPAGLVTHPAPGNYSGTLVNAILHHCPDLKGVGDAKRPGIVHRLDKGTSGIMVVAKTQKCHEGLVKLFSTHDIERVYMALCSGNNLPIAGKLEGPIGRHPNNRLKMAINERNGRDATTHFKTIKQFKGCALVECRLETGRTHQIRVHLASLLRTPLICDATYGNPKQQLTRIMPEVAELIADYPYPLLHAKKLGFIHPITKEELSFEEAPPEPFSKVLSVLEKENE